MITHHAGEVLNRYQAWWIHIRCCMSTIIEWQSSCRQWHPLLRLHSVQHVWGHWTICLCRNLPWFYDTRNRESVLCSSYLDLTKTIGYSVRTIHPEYFHSTLFGTSYTPHHSLLYTTSKNLNTRFDVRLPTNFYNEELGHTTINSTLWHLFKIMLSSIYIHSIHINWYVLGL